MLQIEDIKEMLEMQKELDEHINQHMELKGGTLDKMLKNKCYALAIELTEMVNEDRFFKYWSYKGRDEKRVIEEYVDCLHFMLSITNTLIEMDDGQNAQEWALHYWDMFLRRVQRNIIIGYQSQELRAKGMDTIGKFFYHLSGYYNSSVVYNLQRLLEYFEKITELFEINLDEVKEEYHRKNKINHQRQEENY